MDIQDKYKGEIRNNGKVKVQVKRKTSPQKTMEIEGETLYGE